MLYLETQKGKEVMKESGFQQEIGGTDDLTKRNMKSTRGCVQLSSNDNFFAYTGITR